MAYTTVDDGSEYFHTILYTGNGSNGRAITNDANAGDFQPDWLWIKSRSSSSLAHRLYDSSRGAANDLRTHGDNADTQESNALASFDSNGFTIGSAGDVNTNSATFVAWQWKANGGTTTTNDASATSIGTIDSVYQANTTAGFSIVTYTGTGSAGTIAHGLGVTPKLIIIKNRDTAESWRVASDVIGYGNQLLLGASGSDTEASDTNTFNNTAPTSTVFSVGTRNATNKSGDDLVAYVFAPIQGYSKIDSYIGNNSTNGTFVYTGFKPAWLLIKRTDSTTDWRIFDNKRDSDNVVKGRLFPNTSGSENTSQDSLDFYSNGFKLKNTNSGSNGSGGEFIYMAFAEHPFVSSKGVPVTAR
jgi:hypothetical protein